MRKTTKAAPWLLALGVCSAMLSATARAAPPTGAANDRGAFVVLGKPPAGGIDFTFGWRTSAQFDAPAVGYWLGVYDVTNSHYVWASDNVLPQFSAPVPGQVAYGSMEMRYADANALPPGDYLVNFFVRSSYSPAANAAVVQLPFTVR